MMKAAVVFGGILPNNSTSTNRYVLSRATVDEADEASMQTSYYHRQALSVYDYVRGIKSPHTSERNPTNSNTNPHT